jgi:hypothetical protein
LGESFSENSRLFRKGVRRKKLKKILKGNLTGPPRKFLAALFKEPPRKSLTVLFKGFSRGLFKRLLGSSFQEIRG